MYKIIENGITNMTQNMENKDKDWPKLRHATMAIIIVNMLFFHFVC